MKNKELYEMPRVEVNALCPENLVCASIPGSLKDDALFEEEFN